MNLAGIVVLRNRDVVGSTPVPQVPGTWTLVPQGRTGWVYLVDPSGLAVWWYTALDGPDAGYPTKVVGVALATTTAGVAWLKAFAADNDKAWTLPELRSDGGAEATAIKAAWREKDGATEILRSTVAGFDYRADAERYATVAGIPG